MGDRASVTVEIAPESAVQALLEKVLTDCMRRTAPPGLIRLRRGGSAMSFELLFEALAQYVCRTSYTCSDSEGQPILHVMIEGTLRGFRVSSPDRETIELEVCHD